MVLRISRLIKFVRGRTRKKEHIQFALTALFAVVLNLLAVIIPVLQKQIIDSMSIDIFNHNMVVLFLVAGITISVVSVLETFILNNLFMDLKQNIEFELLESVTRKDNKMLEARGPGAFMVSIFGNSEQIAMLLNTNYFSVLAVCLATIATLVISIKWTWVFSFIVIIAYVIMFIIIRISNKIYARNFDEAREVVYELNPKVLEFIENRKSIMAYVNVKMYETELKDIFNKRDRKFRSAFAANALGGTALSSVKNFALTLFFAISMIQIIDNQLEVSSFIALLSYFNLVFIPISALHELSGDLSKFDVLFNRIKDNIDIIPEVSLPEDDTIQMQRCSFSYESKDTTIDLDITLTGRTGLVGLTGEGKTTILKILTGKLLPNDGFVLYGKTDVSKIPESIINASIRLYSQDPEIFNESLKFNITLGKKELVQAEYYDNLDMLTRDINNSLNWLVNSQIQKENNEDSKKYIDIILNLYGLNEKQFSNNANRSQLIQALKGKNIKDISLNLAPKYFSRTCYLKEKYDRIISELGLEYLSDRHFGQRGKDISGGEKNKVALARFLLPESNEPFIIDEPFINLDLLSEQENLDVLKAHTNNKNGIVISHKMNVIKALSDNIIVLENGRISEKGTHDELIRSGGLYSKLYDKYLENTSDLEENIEL